ncbi:hypothetical protein LQ327_32410 [Actinomycetospora endophytica]|uniref:GDSL-like lipase/acylhydrolase family protein n=1 Tax=Actinomycetospora endophytica TaxID=2291215 RepID=A0ABS8PM82_9PSEU|nr:hypothetical protein [Actinomycetospora endophytica]MCD2198084.1 hypothetical protein [Actinomycetospora endophytica]
MRPSRRVLSAALCLAVTALTLTTTTAARPADASPRAATPVTLVALGDSWAAGTAAGGAPLVDPGGTDGTACRRTVASYPARSGPRLAPQAWTSRACASTSGGPNSQFTALNSAVTRVLITVGADATGLGALTAACASGRTPAECDAATARTDRAIDAIPAALDSSFADIRRRAPAAALVLTTYPRPTEGLACAAGARDPATAHRLDATVSRLDDVLTDRARAARVTVVDVRTGFVAHSVCARQPWITPFTGTDPLRTGAPTAAGQTVIADAVDATVTAQLTAAADRPPSTTPAPPLLAPLLRGAPGRLLAPLFPA